MNFKTYFFALPAESQQDLAQRAGTSHQMLAQIARGNKTIELGFAQVIESLTFRIITLDDLPLTERAKAQRKIIKKAESNRRKNP